jgi:hypothetical protein
MHPRKIKIDKNVARLDNRLLEVYQEPWGKSGGISFLDTQDSPSLRFQRLSHD